MREVEFKWCIPDAESFRALCREVAAGPPVPQENRFFDTADARLAARGIACRVRIEPGRGVVTVKGPTRSRAGGPAERAESERDIAEAEARRLAADPAGVERILRAASETGDPLARRALDAASGAPLVARGAFRNERRRAELPLAGGRPRVLELDRTELPGDRVDYELELELDPGDEPEELRKAVEALLASLGIEPQPSTSKLARLREALGEA